jgi:ParB/RepB/Spo0J family partition protein
MARADDTSYEPVSVLVPLKEIRVSERMREELGDIDELAESIDAFGQLQPIILNRDGELIAGFRRFTACLKLGRTHIRAEYMEDLPELRRREIELEENIRRLEMTWAEQAKTIHEINELRATADPEWSQAKTAALIGRTRASVSQNVAVAKALEDDPELASRQDSLVGALRELKRTKSLEARAARVERKKKGFGSVLRAEVVHGDALDLIKELKAESIDAIVTNPPFGISLELGKKRREVYRDDEEYIVDLIQSILPEFYRVLAPDSWLVSFFDLRKITHSNYHRQIFDELQVLLRRVSSDKKYEPLKPSVETLVKLAYDGLGLTGWIQAAGFDYVQIIPAVWAKPNKTHGSLGNPSKGMVSAYEAFVYAAKGQGAELVRRGDNNVYVYDTPKPSERVTEIPMNIDLCEKLVTLVALGGETILDPFAGEASFGLGALRAQVNFLGFELEEAKAKKANMILQEAIYD